MFPVRYNVAQEGRLGRAVTSMQDRQFLVFSVADYVFECLEEESSF